MYECRAVKSRASVLAGGRGFKSNVERDYTSVFIIAYSSSHAQAKRSVKPWDFGNQSEMV